MPATLDILLALRRFFTIKTNPISLAWYRVYSFCNTITFRSERLLNNTNRAVSAAYASLVIRRPG